MKLTDRPKLPPILLLTNLHYFIVTAIVAAAWHPAFSWKDNYTSSLGNTACGVSEGLYVCSPLHALMNASFMLQGIVLLIAGILLARQYRVFKAARNGLLALAASGVCAIVIGLVPENVDLPTHNLAATLTFLLAIIGLILLASSKLLPGVTRVVVAVLTAISLVALLLFGSGSYFGLGLGGMERLMDYSQALATVLIAVALLRRPAAAKQ